MTPNRRHRVVLATVLLIAFSVSACTSGEDTPDQPLTPTSTNSTTDAPAPEAKTPEQIAQEIEEQVLVREPEHVVSGELKSGPSAFSAELAVLGVEAAENSTRLVLALRSTTGAEETLDLAAFNEHTPLNPGIRDVSLTDPKAERILKPYLAFADGNGAEASFCLCSDSPKTLNDTWFTVYATMPKLDPATTTVTVTVPGFEPVQDVAVTAAESSES